MKKLIDIPDDSSSEPAKIIVSPILHVGIEKAELNPEQFFGVSHLNNIDQLLRIMRDEWEH
ncbi:MAG: hypothetical protein Q7U66_16680 [Methylobacter sp.]|nr:hypothetical protein [Methylobacter sp.]